MIDDQAATEAIAKLLFLQSEDARAPIRLHIDSLGGHVAAGLAIRDTLDDLAVPVYTHALANAGGVAVILLVHGARGHRTATRRSWISLVPSTGVEAIVTELLAKDTGQGLQQIAEDLRASRRFDAEQARSYGLVDRIEE